MNSIISRPRFHTSSFVASGRRTVDVTTRCGHQKRATNGAYCVVPGRPKCGIFPDQAAARGYDRAGNGQGTLADRILKGVPRRGELRGVFVRTALAERLRLPGVRQGSRGGAEEPGIHLRMLRLWSADFDHGGHCAAPHQAAADGLVLGRASDVDPFQRNVGAAIRRSTRPHLQDRLATDTEAAAIDGRSEPRTSRRGR